MSPIDDELRALLSSRASDVDPAPDPLGGIESRARGLRRRRVLTSVSGAAAGAVAVAVAVPLLVSGSGTTAVKVPGDGTPTPTSTVTTDHTAYDPANPWAPRGVTQPRVMNQASAEGNLLFSDTAGGRFESFYATDTELGYLWQLDAVSPVSNDVRTALPAARQVLTWVTPSRLVVVAAPDAVVEYSSEGDGGWQQISDVGQAPAGIGLVPLDAEDPNDSIRVTEADGTIITQPAPDWSPPHSGTPVNVLGTWVHRGDPQTISDSTVIAKFNEAEPGSNGAYRSLYDGTRDGVSFTIGQAWHQGLDDAAYTVAYDSTGNFYLGPQTPRDPWVLGAVFSTGAAKDLLVLLPRPGAGRIGYSPDDTSPFTDVASGRSQQMEVGLVDRDPKAQQDRVQVHRGDDSIILTEGIAKLTCGAKECG